MLLEEWDFSECPEAEVEHCCYYEYARESEPIRKDVAVRRAAGRWTSGLAPHDWLYYETAWFLTFFEALTCFPETPWLSLPRALRRAVLAKCAMYEGPFQSVGPERIPANENIPVPFIPDDVASPSLHSVHVVEIDWTASDKDIKAKFAQWLAQNRPSAELIWEKRGRVSDRELLKYLGAWRLLKENGGNWQRAADWAQAHGRGTKWTPVYADQSGWIRARTNAQRMLKRGIVLSPAALLPQKLKISGFDKKEQARLRALVAQTELTEIRRLEKLKAEEALDKQRASILQRLADKRAD